ncbi:holo-ACP synthase [Stieleria varia]|uniref:Holo-[acyl-carrier-protein] synthase n=1 Tax=Stieleria varia TaxID=2528005 RepID=A0A5C6AZJ3_9BACT|nr:holo-ACP synthase [Stieleria varia]TWU05068.1 Holo-[acyl-carrier-protein] synthase [Stieleria varia]
MAILGIGTEIVEIVRIATMIETHGEQFLERVYTADEVDYCVGSGNASLNFATRWAAKEAAMKALRCRRQGVRWNEIELEVRPAEGPVIVLHGTAAEVAMRNDVEKLHVSLGGCRTHATAYVIATDDEVM